MQELRAVRGWQSLVWAPTAKLGGAVSLWDRAGMHWELCLGNCPQLDLESICPPAPEVLF